MSCSVCAGYSSYNCPACGESTSMMTCPDCKGDGVEYYAFDTYRRAMARCTELAYKILPYDEDDAKERGQRWCQGCVEKCKTCKGEGEIPEYF